MKMKTKIVVNEKVAIVLTKIKKKSKRCDKTKE